MKEERVTEMENCLEIISTEEWVQKRGAIFLPGRENTSGEMSCLHILWGQFCRALLILGL